MLRLPALFALLLAGSPCLAADPPLVEVRGIFLYATGEQMKTALAAAGRPEMPGGQISAAELETMRAKLQELGADIFSEPRAVAASGMKTSINAVRELRYPTEFSISKETPAKWTPTGFQSRNVGVEMEFEARVNGEDIEVTVHPTVTTFLGFIDYSRGKDSPPDALPIENLLKAPLTEGGCWQPVFLRFDATSSFLVRSGNSVLLGGTMKAERIPRMGGLPEVAGPKSEPAIFVFLTAKTAE